MYVSCLLSATKHPGQQITYKYKFRIQFIVDIRNRSNSIFRHIKLLLKNTTCHVLNNHWDEDHVMYLLLIYLLFYRTLEEPQTVIM